MITFKNRQLETVAQAHYSGISGLIVEDDEFEKDLETGIATYTFKIDKTDESIGNVSVGNYVFAQDNDTIRCFEIIEIDEDHYSKSFYCEDTALDLLQEVGPLKSNEGQKLAKYINDLVVGTGWSVGINELSDYSRKLTYDSTVTIVKRIRQIAKDFDAEVDFVYEILSDGTPGNRYINFYKKIGKDEKVRLEFDDNVRQISKNVNIRDLATTILAIGQDDLTLNDYMPKNGEIDEDNIILKNGYLIDTDAVERWKRADVETNGEIVKVYHSEAKTQERLLAEALRQLKKRRYPAYKIEVDLNNVPQKLNLGDTVSIVDHDYMPALALTARITAISKSFVSGETTKAVISNIEIETDSINDRIADLKRLVSETAKELNDANNKLTDFESNVNSSISNTNNVLNTIEQNLLDKLNNTNNKLTDLEQNITHEIGDTNNVLGQMEQELLNKLNKTNSVLSSTEQALLDKLNKTNSKLDTTSSKVNSNASKLDETKQSLESKIDVVKSGFDKKLETTKNSLGQSITTLENDLGGKITVVKDELGNTVKVIEGTVNDKISDAKQEFDEKIKTTKNSLGQTISVLENDFGQRISVVKNELGQTINIVQGDLTSKINSANSNIDKTKQTLDSKINSTKHDLDSKLSSTNSKLDSTSNKLSGVSSKVDSTASDLNRTKSEMTQKFTDTNSKIDSTNSKVGNLEQDTYSKFNNTNNKITNLENDLSAKADLELTQQQLDRINEQNKQMSEELKSKASLEVIRNFELKILETLQSQREISEASKKELQDLANRVVGIQTNLSDMSAKWTFIDRYITMGEEGFMIGNADSGSKILINEEKITMKSNGQDVMTIANGVLTINNGVFLTSLQIGYYIESVYESDEYCNAIRYVGPDWRR